MVQFRWFVAAVTVAAGCGDSGKQATVIDAAVQHDTAMLDAQPDAGPAANVLDDGFGTHGSIAYPTPAVCGAFALDASDRALVVTTTMASTTLSRYTAAGVLDPTFGTGGSVTVSNTGLGGLSAFALASGKIVVLANEMANNQYAPHLWRYTSTGTVDADVAVPNTVASFTLIARERADGDLELVTLGASGGHAFGLVRVTADGALDSSFGTNGVVALDTSAYGMSPGYYPHAVALGDGDFILGGDSFAPVGQGSGPINAHLLRVKDGAITLDVDYDNQQVFSLASDGGQPVVLMNPYPDNHATIEAVDPTTLVVEPANAFTLPFAVAGGYGLFSGSSMSIGHGIVMLVSDVSQQLQLARYSDTAGYPLHAIGTLDGTQGYCGAALDSQARPVFASAYALERFLP